MSFSPTDEQQFILDAFQTKRNLKVQAGAGTGKTTTLRMLGEVDPNRRGIYFAYNRAIADDAKASFPANVACSTAHSLAYRAVGYKFKERLNGPRLPSRVTAQTLGISDELHLGDKKLSPAQLGRLVMDTVSNFCHSANDKMLPYHVPHVEGLPIDHWDDFRDAILDIAFGAWENLQRPQGQLKFEHDHYLKIWQLSHPRLGGDYVLLDEAQDANPCVSAIVEEQTHMQRILVGDENQAIYGWRGARNAMREFSGQELFLSQSFRFGPAVAAEANKWLHYLESPLVLKGFDQMDSSVAPLADARAVLCRSNAGAMQEIIDQGIRGRRTALVGGGDAIRRLCFAARDLKEGRRTDHPELFLFETWDEVKQYAEDGGTDLAVLVRMVEKFGIPTILQAVDRLVEERSADVVISTAHKAKGREWETVRIASDFPEPKQEGGNPSKEEAMLAYVAVTRARYVLDNSGLAWIDRIKGTIGGMEVSDA